jgi:hypothetical protein
MVLKSRAAAQTQLRIFFFGCSGQLSKNQVLRPTASECRAIFTPVCDGTSLDAATTPPAKYVHGQSPVCLFFCSAARDCAWELWWCNVHLECVDIEHTDCYHTEANHFFHAEPWSGHSFTVANTHNQYWGGIHVCRHTGHQQPEHIHGL